MLGSSYKVIEDQEWFLTIEEALLTQCHICGTELEWQLTIRYNESKELPEIYGKSFSCGVTFLIEPNSDTGGTTDGDGYITKIVLG